MLVKIRIFSSAFYMKQGRLEHGNHWLEARNRTKCLRKHEKERALLLEVHVVLGEL